MTTASDLWADAPLVPIPGEATGSTVGMTAGEGSQDFDGYVDDAAQLASIWWKFQPDDYCKITLDWSGSESIQAPAVYRDPLSGPAATIDDMIGVEYTGIDGTSEWIVGQPGVTYWVRFLDFKTSPHAYQLSLTSTPAELKTIVSRPGNRESHWDSATNSFTPTIWTPPSQWPCGDNDLTTYRTYVNTDQYSTNGDYGYVVTAKSSLSDEAIAAGMDQGTEFVPDGYLQAVAQRGAVIYSSDYPVGWEMDQGDGGGIGTTSPGLAGAMVTDVRESNGQIFDNLTLYIVQASGDSNTDRMHVVPVYEWWVETDVVVAVAEEIFTPTYIDAAIAADFLNAGVTFGT